MTLEEVKIKLQNELPPTLHIYTPREVNQFDQEFLGNGPDDGWDENDSYFMVCQELDAKGSDSDEWLWGLYTVDVEKGFKACWMNPSKPYTDIDLFIADLWKEIPNEYIIKAIAI
jgi:hypothetical protein